MRKFSVTSQEVKIMQEAQQCSIEQAKRILYKAEYLSLVEEAKTVADLKQVLFDFISRTY